jgi:hypothetical protein
VFVSSKVVCENINALYQVCNSPATQIQTSKDTNQVTREGVPDFVRTAVLLERADSEPFIIRVYIRMTVDRGQSLGAFSGGRSNDGDPIVIDPRQPGVYPKGEYFDLENMQSIDLSAMIVPIWSRSGDATTPAVSALDGIDVVDG